MFSANRISKKTFFAAAALGAVAVFPVHVAAEIEPTTAGSGYVEFDFDGVGGTNKTGYAYAAAWLLNGHLDFTKTGSGDLLANVGVAGTNLYGLHQQYYSSSLSNIYFGYYRVHRLSSTGAIIEEEGDDNYVPQWAFDSEIVSSVDSPSLMRWKSGEVRVDEGVLELVGYVNAWFNFGELFNNEYLGTSSGGMTGATRITVSNGSVLDLSGNNNVPDRESGGMTARNCVTTYQFLRNIQAGDLGVDSTSTIRLGSSSMLHLDVHIESWSDNTRSRRADGTYLDNTLAFGGSIGVLNGAAAVYKTGAGDLTLLNTSAGFTGELYAAGGELILAGDNTASGAGTYTFSDASGDISWTAKISSAFYNAQSVNITGTYSETGTNGESRLGSVARSADYEAVSVGISGTNPAEEHTYHVMKEEYFARSDEATLVIAENQKIKNFQSYFNGGYAVSSGTTAESAVSQAGNISKTVSAAQISVDDVVATAPIIAGTGIGSTLVIPGGNYSLIDGEWTLNTDASTGEMIGGVLLIDQQEGMGGVYAGSITGCRVTIYDKTKFNAYTEAAENNANAGTSASRLEAVRQGEDEIKSALTAIYGGDADVDSLYSGLGVGTDGSFALDNEVAHKVVEYFKNGGSDGSTVYYVDYIADENVTGGILALDGAGDLALVLTSSNFSGIHIASTRTGKTILNISALNALPGSVVAAGGNVSIISTQKDTLKTKLSFAENSRLIFTSGETISTVVRETVTNDTGRITGYTDRAGGNTILIGDLRKSVIAFDLVQDEVYGDVYVERGIDLDLSGAESVFPNANSLTLWRGEAIRSDESDIASSSLSFKGDGYFQVINNLTGDDSARVDFSGHGVMVVNSTSNASDSYSGLSLGSYAGLIRGEGSLVKGGNATFSLGGGVQNTFTGTTEVGAGTLRVTKSDSLSYSSALILNGGTSVSMVGGQHLRNLFGAAGSSVSVDGALTVGSDALIANGDNRPVLATNLGTSSYTTLGAGTSSASYSNDASFARFDGVYDLEGNLLTVSSFSDATQADATKEYLTATTKSAYSGFDATTLEQFVGVENYDGNVLLSQEQYDEIVAFAKNPSGTLSAADGSVELTSSGVLGELAGLYSELSSSKYFIDNIGKDSNGYYSTAILEGFFDSGAEFREYLSEKGLTTPSGENDVQKATTNQERFEKIVECWNELNEQKETESLKAAFSTEESTRAKFSSDFGNVKNLGGTSLLTDEDQANINEAVGNYGVALEEYNALLQKIASETDPEEIAALEEEAEALYEKIYVTTDEQKANDECCLLDKVVKLYDGLSEAKDEINSKLFFAGISISGAFADSVTTSGDLVNSDWIEDLAFAGTLTASSLTKTGDNTLTLTGNVNVSSVSVQGGKLAVDVSKLPSTIPGGISVERGASLVVTANGTSTFNYSVSGYGNFVKAGSGKLTLSGNVVYTGTTTVEGGVLQMSIRNPQTFDDGTFLAAQGDIYVTGEGAGLILNQTGDDVTWNRNLTVSADSVSVEKIGSAALTVTGTATFGGDDASLTVSAGTLKLSGETEVSGDLDILINTGATLSLASLKGTADDLTGTEDDYSVSLRGNGALEIAADGTSGVSLRGNGVSVSEPVLANGQGYSLDVFTGSVRVSSGTLTLSGESVFSYARGATVAGGATLEIADSSSQSLKKLEGSGSVVIGSGSTLSLENSSGDRISWDYVSTKSYIYDESDFFSAPTFYGTVSGNGTLAVSGEGVMQLQGVVQSDVEVRNGGQLIIDAQKASDLDDYGKTITVSGSAVYYTDAQGRRVVNAASDPATSDAGNVSTNVAASVPASLSGFLESATGYIPRNLTASYKDADGKTVSVPVENVICDEDGKLIDSVSRREVSVSATQWDYVPEGDTTLSANWTVLGADGKAADLSKAIVWDADEGKFVLGTYEYIDEDSGEKRTASYTAGYSWLAESVDADGGVSYVIADVKTTTEHANVSEVILSVGAGSSVSLNTGTLEFSDGGQLGKIGDGTLTVSGTDIAVDGFGGVNVYEGELVLANVSDEWVFSEDSVARIALGATLTVNLDAGVTPIFSTVYGSGTLNLTNTNADNRIDITISGEADAVSGTQTVLPVYSKDGAYFNGVLSFSGNFNVDVSDTEMPSVNTTEDVTISLTDVTIRQSQNSEILSENLTVSGTVTVVGDSSASGLAIGNDARRLTVSSVNVSEDSELRLQNIGFGFDADTAVAVIVDRESVSNTFYIGLTGDRTGALVAEGTIIDIGMDTRPNLPGDSTLLKNLSIIQSAAASSDDAGYTWTVSGGDLSAAGSESEELNSVFGVSKLVYEQLAANGGTFYVGVEAGTMVLTDLDGFTGETANGVDIELLTLRSTVSDTAGTLKIESDDLGTGASGFSAAFSSASSSSSGEMSALRETISGGGNVEFSGSKGTIVYAKQEYLGTTTVSGKVQFVGAGQENHSSSLTIAGTGELIGGVTMLGREIGCSGTMLRNMADDGTAGTTTLRLSLSDPRLPTNIVFQMDVDTAGKVTNASVFSDSALADLGVSVSFAGEGSETGVTVTDGKVEVIITDNAFGESYSVYVPVDSASFPKSAGETADYASTSISAETVFTVKDGGTWRANLASGDGVSAGTAIFESGSKIVLEGLNDSSALGKTVVLVDADNIGTASGEIKTVVKDRSNVVADAIRRGNQAEGWTNDVMVFTDESGAVNARLMISDFSALGVDYSDGISSSFLDALSTIASVEDAAEYGVWNADTMESGHDKDLIFALNSLNASQLSREVDKLSPNSFAAMLAMPAVAFASDIARIHERLDQRRYDGANPLRESGEYEFFVSAQSDFAENDSAKGSPIFDYNLYGVTAGADWKPNFETTLGLALGYTYGKAKIHNGGGKIEMDDMRLTAFGSRIFGNVYLEGGVQFGMADFDTRRNTIAGTASGDTDSVFGGVFVTLGTVFTIFRDKKDDSGLYFTPSVGLSWFHTEIDGFRESGTAGLDTDDMDGDSLRARVALGLQWVVPFDTWTVRLGLEAAYLHDFLGDELDADARFVAAGPRFSTSGKALPKDVFSVGPTLDLAVTEHDSLWLGYGLEIDTDSGVSHSVNAGFRHRF